MNISELEFQQSNSPAQAIERATSILRSVGVDPHQLAIWLLGQHSKFDVAHANIYEDACELVKGLTNQSHQSQPLESAELSLATNVGTLTATQIGKMLAARSADLIHPPSAQQVNNALEQLNFHSRDPKKIWQLTKLGKEYGRIVNVTDDQNKARLQVRWLPTVIDRLAPLFTIGKS
jgi:hypothetical protein